MNTRMKSPSVIAMLGAALLLPIPASRAGVEKAQSGNGGTVTRIRTNGHVAQANLSDGGANGYLLASRDLVSGTSALDFSYAAINPENPDIIFLWQGAGEIPNSAFTNAPNWGSARLAVTTPFPVIRFEINQATSEITSTPWPPVTFELTWVPNGFFTSVDHVESVQSFGPVKRHFQGTSSVVSASVSGTWDGHTQTNGSGNLQDTKNNTVEREILVEPNP
jgi:hypothetical protein